MATQQPPNLHDEGSNPSPPAITALDIMVAVTIIGIFGYLAFLFGGWVSDWLPWANLRYITYNSFWNSLYPITYGYGPPN